MIESLVKLVSTGFGLGWFPVAPGTLGTLIGVPLAWWLLGQSVGRQIFIMILLLAGAVPLCHWASLWMGGGDASQVVADEYLAFPIAVIGLSKARGPWVMGIAFLLFRVFDVTKLPPIGQIEAIGGGLGIVCDDVMAAAYAWVVLAIGLTLWSGIEQRRKRLVE